MAHPPRFRWTFTATLLALLPFVAAPAGAQQMPLRAHFGAGFVVSAPHQFMGFSAQVVSLMWGGLGIYADVKFDRSSPSEEPEFDPGLTAEEAEDAFGDQLFASEGSWRTVNVALIRPVLPELLLYLGAGHSSETHYRQYFDGLAERGLNGFYWVEEPRESGTRVNVLGGAFFRISSSILIQFGVETKPRGVTAGGVYTVAR